MSGNAGREMAKRADRRVERSKAALQQALLTLIQERGFEALSVQDITDRANVGRATFYAHFQNKEDLLASGIDGLRAGLREVQRRALTDPSSRSERTLSFSHELFAHANAHREVFQAMVGKRSGAVVQQLLHKMAVDLVRDELAALSARGGDRTIPTEAVAQFIGSGLFGLLMWWGQGRMRMPVEEVDALFRRLAVPAMKAPLG